jgi:hypothetical protein
LGEYEQLGTPRPVLEDHRAETSGTAAVAT